MTTSDSDSEAGPSERDPLDSVEGLRVMANPNRIKIYELLVRSGPSTVSGLAGRLQIAVGSVSYHLGQLERIGLVREADPAQTDRRTHWWQAVPGGLRWSPANFLDSAGNRELSTSVQRLLTDRWIRRVGHWLNTWHKWSPDWLEAAFETDIILRLSPAELAELSVELQQVVGKWSRRTKERATEDASAVFVVLNGFPIPEDD